MDIRKTKIVCTIGPATGDLNLLRELIRSGMDVARLNFSHGELDLFEQWIRVIREEAASEGRTVAILQDLPGPKMRTGAVRGGAVHLTAGSTFILKTGPGEGSERSVRVSYAGLPKEVSVGDPVFIDDGRIRLRVVRTTDTEIETQVIGEGVLRDGRGDRKSVV